MIALKDPAFREVLERFQRQEDKIVISGIEGSAKALFVSLLHRILKKTLLVVTPTSNDAASIFRDVSLFLPGEEVLQYPSWDLLASDVFSSQTDIEVQRIETLSKMIQGTPLIVVASVGALLQKVTDVKIIRDYMQTVSIGDFLERNVFLTKLDEGGYRRVSLVDEKGEYSVRGHVIDIFPPVEANPLRLLFIGDEVESIKNFDADSQRSSEERVDFILTPARGVVLSDERQKQAFRYLKNRANDIGLSRVLRDRLLDRIGNGHSQSINPQLFPIFFGSIGEDDEAQRSGKVFSLLSCLPETGVLILNNPMSVEREVERTLQELDRALLKAKEQGKFYLERKDYLLTKEDLSTALAPFQKLYCEDLEVIRSGENPQAVRFDITTPLGLRDTGIRAKTSEMPLQPLMEKLRTWVNEGYLVNFICSGDGAIGKMQHLFDESGLAARRDAGDILSGLFKHEGKGELLLRDGKISKGFVAAHLKWVLLSDEEVFGPKVRKRKARPSHEGYFLRSFGELKEGDFVVHADHGIGVYRGLEKLSLGDMENDFLRLEYLEGDKLFIPVDRLDQIQRYIGPDGHSPKIDKLGGASWEAAKRKVKRSVEEIAEELVSLYAARDGLERTPFAPTDAYYDDFSSSFAFEETPDQAKTIEEVNFDMSDAKPMDRLICGDAGFGKTEVAVRAAFRAVMEGKQAAVLVPTTILAEQHFRTFSRRLEKYPVRIDVLNRFKTKKEQQQVIEDLRKGVLDIVVGTHRLLQKDVSFKDLGLVVVDEEQRFGVSDKEKLKRLRTLVDVLTLTATPIPRTLQLSLVGIRDLSIISTPPQDRHSIRTHVLEFDDETIQNAIRAEIERHGQIFFVHDRIQSIYNMEKFLKRIVPEAKIATAHGRMKSKELEDVMVRFVRQDIDVLVCTTIIGSGIDIPTANTIIVNRADRFGLAQLYQLRGRVGRSKEEAFAYLLVPKGAMLSPDTQKRLQVIGELTEPGSGFTIASHDLEIRGAGNILGMSQSGHVAAVGYEMYITLIENTIRELRGEREPEVEIRPEIHLGLSAFIPEDYMPDMHRRLVSYKRLSMSSTEEDLSELRSELMDCYGFVPPKVDRLFEVIRIRNLAKRAMAERIDYDGKNLSVSFARNSTMDPEKIMKIVKRQVKGTRFTPDFKLCVPIRDLANEEILQETKGLLKELLN